MEPFPRLEDLTLMDDYMFGAVMQDEKLIRPLIGFILDIQIKSITYIEPQRSMKSGFDAKGIRLDLYVEDEKASCTTSRCRPPAAGRCPSACATISLPST